MGSIFRFKQFEVDQAGCAMRINTDGVLLAAMVSHSQPATVLDVGTGTGVIAMMLAQRFPGASVDAVEIDPSAAAAAEANFSNSPFADRTRLYALGIEEFSPPHPYDLIVSNPPYFVNDLKNPEKRKEIARHPGEFFFDMLLRKSAAMLQKTGSLWLILPVKQAEKVVVNAVLQRLFPVKIISIFSDHTKEPFRKIICLAFGQQQTVHEQVYIYASQGVYTDQYKQLLGNFFLAF